MLTRPQPYEAEAEAVTHEAEAKTHEAEAEAKTHEGRSQVFRPRGRGQIRGQVHESAEVWNTKKFVMVHL